MQTSQLPTTRFYVTLTGIALTLLGVAGLIYATYPLGTVTGTNIVGGPGTYLELELPIRMRASDSNVITFQYDFSVAPTGVDDTGEVIVPVVYQDISVALHAPSFDTSPPSGQSIPKHVESGIPSEWLWIVKPKQEGQNLISLQFAGIPGPALAEVVSGLGVDQLPANSAIMDTLNWPVEDVLEQVNNPEHALNLVIPVSVTDVLGLTVTQARVVSAVVAFFGFVLTITQLYGKWQEQRTVKEKKQKHSARKRKRKQ